MASLSVGRIFLCFSASVLMVSQSADTFAASAQMGTREVRHLLRTVSRQTLRNGSSSVTNASRGLIEQKSGVMSKTRRLSATKHEKSVSSRLGKPSRGMVIGLSDRHGHARTAVDESMLHLANGNLLIMAALVGVKELEDMLWGPENNSEQLTSLLCTLNSSDKVIQPRPTTDSGLIETASPPRYETSAARKRRRRRRRAVDRSNFRRPTLSGSTAVPGERAARRTGPMAGNTTTAPQRLAPSIKNILARLEAGALPDNDVLQLLGKVKSVHCLAHLATSRTSLLSGQKWAQMMADSSAHLGAGTMDQELDLVGIIGECLAVQVPPALGFQTKYCVVTFMMEQVSRPFEMASMNSMKHLFGT